MPVHSIDASVLKAYHLGQRSGDVKHTQAPGHLAAHGRLHPVSLWCTWPHTCAHYCSTTAPHWMPGYTGLVTAGSNTSTQHAPPPPMCPAAAVLAALQELTASDWRAAQQRLWQQTRLTTRGLSAPAMLLQPATAAAVQQQARRAGRHDRDDGGSANWLRGAERGPATLALRCSHHEANRIGHVGAECIEESSRHLSIHHALVSAQRDGHKRRSYRAAIHQPHTLLRTAHRHDCTLQCVWQRVAQGLRIKASSGAGSAEAGTC